MTLRPCRIFRGFCLIGAFLFLPFLGLAQGAGSGEQSGRSGGPSGTEQGPDTSAGLHVNVQYQDGGLVTVFALITLRTAEGKVVNQVKADGGQAEFAGLAPGRYTIQVTAEGYESTKQAVAVEGVHSVATVLLRPKAEEFIDKTATVAFGGAGGAGADRYGIESTVKEQRQLLKIAQALRDNKPEKARMDLFKLYLDSEMDTNLNYLYGVYEKEMKDIPLAKHYWKQAVGADSKNFPALMELGHTALDEGKPAEALPYLKQAVQASPAIWQPHAMMVVAYSKLKQYPQAIEEAQRALELGHNQAAFVQSVVATPLAADGDREQAVKVLRENLKDHPDPDTQELLATLERIGTSGVAGPTTPSYDFPPILPSAWMPTRVDDKVPPVEAGVPCSLETVLHNASMQVTELVKDVDRFEATESLEHVRIARDGVPSRPQMRTYRYLVSIGEVRPGILSVDEYRDAKKDQDDPPDGVVTVGLPAMALVFHSAQLDNYKFTCEGLARSSSGLSWQVYFQQRADRIPTLHGYRLGDNAFAVGLKGRAWISADTFQIVRLETDLVKPYPEIRLAAEHTSIVYGPVRFRSKDVKMWLPQQAEVYFDWRGMRVHRRLNFTNYSLFSVDTMQKINPPKQAEAIAPDSLAPPAPVKPN
jgi:tetratricopeptide (TPR) repeat protein